MKKSFLLKSIFLLFIISIFHSAYSSEVKILDIVPTPLFPRQTEGTELKQLVRMSLMNEKGYSDLDLILKLQSGKTYKQNISSVSHGEGTYDILVPDIKKPENIIFEIKHNNKVLAEKTVNWKPQKKWKIYYAAVSHQDLGFETYYQNIRRGVREGGLDLALQYCRETDNWDEDSKFRWNVESSEPIIRWINKRSQAEVDELIRRIKEGRIELGAIHNTISSQMAGYEVFARSFYTPNRYVADMLDIEPAKVAVINDVTGITRSWPLFSKEADIPYLMHGSNAPNCLQDLYDLPVFYWLSPDGDKKNKTLCRADSYYSENKMRSWDEANMERLISRNDRPDWVYDCILAYDSHDFALPTMDNAENIREWNKKYSYPRVVCSVLSSFFDDVASQANKANIIETDKDAPDSWDDQDATDAELLSLARRTTSEVSTSEKFSTIAMSYLGGYPTEEIFQAYNGLVMYHEHTNGAIHGGNHHYYEVEKETHRQLVDEAKLLTDSVMDMTMPKLTSLVKVKDNSLIVFNPLNWTRSDIVQVSPSDMPSEFKSFELFDPENGKQVSVQLLSNGNYAFYADNIPSLGYKSFRINECNGKEIQKAKPSGDLSIDNSYYRITIDKKSNKVSGIYDKDLDTDILDKESPYALGEYIYYDDFRKVYLNSEFTGISCYKGAVADEIHISQKAYLAENLKLVVYVYHDIKKIDFSLTLDKLSNDEPLIGSWARNFKEAAFCAIPVLIPNYVHHHELAGAVTQPGNPNMQLNSAEAAYYAIQHFADASNDKMGVTISTIDAALVEYGHPRPGLWNLNGRKYKDPVVKPENSNMFLYLMNNFFQTNTMVDQPGYKRFDFSLRSHSGNWVNGGAYKFAWETSTPLYAEYAVMNKKGVLPDNYSFMSVNCDNVVCSALKPAEFNGEGYIARFFELTGKSTDVKVKFNFLDRIKEAFATNLIEDDKFELSVLNKNEVGFTISGHGIRTVRVTNNSSVNTIDELKTEALSDTEIALRWQGGRNKNISHYAIYRSLSPECRPVAINYIGSCTEEYYIDRPHLNYAGWSSNKLLPETKYYYRVCPVDKYNSPGESSDVVECITLSSSEKDAKPNKVQGLYAVHVSPLAPENYVALFFYTNIEHDVDLYEIYRGESIDFIPSESNKVGEVRPSEKILNYKGTYKHSELERQMFNDKSAELYKDYYYRVCAVDNAGQRGAYSEAVHINMYEKPIYIETEELKVSSFEKADGSIKVRIKTPIKDCDIRYTYDHSEPSIKSQKYTGEFIVSHDTFMRIALFDKSGKMVCLKSAFIKSPSSLASSEYGGEWGASKAFDGYDDIGSQWVSLPYGGGTKMDPKEVWIGSLLHANIKVSGVIVSGDDRDFMPDFDNFKIYGRNAGKLMQMGDLKTNGTYLGKKNSYKISFPETTELDAIMLYVSPEELPKSNMADQDGIVRVLELKLVLTDGSIKTIKEIIDDQPVLVDNALLQAAETAKQMDNN